MYFGVLIIEHKDILVRVHEGSWAHCGDTCHPLKFC